MENIINKIAWNRIEKSIGTITDVKINGEILEYLSDGETKKIHFSDSNFSFLIQSVIYCSMQFDAKI